MSQWQEDIIQEQIGAELTVKLLAQAIAEVLIFKYEKSYLSDSQFVQLLNDVHNYPATSVRQIPKSHDIWQKIEIYETINPVPGTKIVFKHTKKPLFGGVGSKASYQDTLRKSLGLYNDRIKTGN